MFKKLLSVTVVALAVGTFTYPTGTNPVNASVRHHRTAIKKVKHVKYHVSKKGLKGRVYTFKGSAKKLRFKTAPELFMK